MGIWGALLKISLVDEEINISRVVGGEGEPERGRFGFTFVEECS